MIRAFRKTGERGSRFLADALAWRAPGRQYALVAWGLLAGTVWFASDLVADPDWLLHSLAGCYLLALLIAVCAIDGRYGIIPDSLVLALAVGGTLEAWQSGELWWRGCEALFIFAAVGLFRSGYRWLRGYDGLGFGDVKFLAAGVFWIGIEGIPGLLLIAVLSASASLLIMKLDGHDLHGKQAISFGPHLALGLWLIWVWGPQAV